MSKHSVPHVEDKPPGPSLPPGVKPSSGTKPSSGIRPSNSRPSSGARLSSNDRPSSGTKPSSGTRPSSNSRPSSGAKLSSDDRPSSGTKPSSGTRLSSNSRPSSGAKLSSDDRPSSGTKPSSGTRPSSNSRPSSGAKLSSDDGPSSGSRSSSGARPPLMGAETENKKAGSKQASLLTESKSKAQPRVLTAEPPPLPDSAASPPVPIPVINQQQQQQPLLTESSAVSPPVPILFINQQQQQQQQQPLLTESNAASPPVPIPVINQQQQEQQQQQQQQQPLLTESSATSPPVPIPVINQQQQEQQQQQPLLTESNAASPPVPIPFINQQQQQQQQPLLIESSSKKKIRVKIPIKKYAAESSNTRRSSSLPARIPTQQDLNEKLDSLKNIERIKEEVSQDLQAMLEETVKVPQTLAKQSLGPVVPQQEELLAAKRKLKKTNRRDAFDPVTLSRRELLEVVVNDDLDFLPIPVLLDVINVRSVSSDLVCLNLSSIEQITDSFFFSLKSSRGMFANLKKLICIGCIHLTDQGIIWASEIFPIAGIELQGCRQLTEKSLYYLAKNCPQLTSVSITGTQVARLPSELSNTEVINLNMAGCPLISASAKFALGSRAQMKEFEKSDYMDLPTKKLVILSHISLDVNVGSLLMDQGPGKRPEAFAYFKDWKVDETSVINMMEFPANSPISNAAITAGCIVIISYPASIATSDDLYQALANQVSAAMSQCSDIVIAVTAVQDGASTLSASDVLARVVQKLNNLCDLMDEQLRFIFASRKWKMDKLDFNDQLSMAAGARLVEDLRRMIASKDMLVSLTLMTKKPQEPETKETVIKLVSTLHDRFPWMYNQYASSCVSMMDHIPKLSFISLLDIFNKIPDDFKKQYVSLYPLPQVGKIVELMVRCGTVFYFPLMKDKPTISNIDVFSKVLTSLQTAKPPRKVRIKCLGDEISCWTMSELDEYIATSVGDNTADTQVSGLRKLLTKQGVFIALVPGTILYDSPEVGECTTEKLFLQQHHLPTSPAIHLSHLWPDDLPDKTLQADKFYSIMPGIPSSVFPLLINESLKIFKMTLLWKTGFFIQLGTVDIVVELLSNKEGAFEGTPAISASARIPVLSKLNENNTEFSHQCLWSTFTLVTTVIESVCKDSNLHTYVTVPCQTCNPKQNRQLSLQRLQCYHFIHPVARATIERAPLKCLYEREKHEKGSRKVPRMIMKDHLGIDVTTIVPYHNYSYMSSVNTVLHRSIRRDPVTPHNTNRCFLCLVGEHLTCLHCGVCRRCTKRLAKMERNIKPGFVFQKLVPGGIPQPQRFFNLDHIATKMTGCMFTTRKNVELLFQKQMSAVYFNELVVSVIRGANVFITLTGKDGRSLEYQAKAGVINDLDGITHSQTSWKCKDGNMILVRLEDSKVDGQTDIVLVLSEQEMKRISIDSVELLVQLRSEVSGLYTIHTPGVKTSWQYQSGVQFKQGMRLLVKPDPVGENEDTPDSLAVQKHLGEVSHEPDQKSQQGLLRVAHKFRETDNVSSSETNGESSTNISVGADFSTNAADISQQPAQFVKSTVDQTAEKTIKSHYSPVFEGILPLTEKTWQQVSIGSKLSEAVLISYSKDYEDRVFKIWDRLKRAGYTVFMDKDYSEIGMSFVQDRAQLVKAAEIIVVGISRSFQGDSSCTREAELCSQFNKQIIALQFEEGYVPEGWLANLVGGKQTLDFTRDDFGDIQMAKLINQLEVCNVTKKADQKKDESDMSSEKTRPGHVMISYHASDIKMAFMLKYRLRSAGYSVWIDTAQYTQDRSQKMRKNAMNKAAAIILCLSHKYRKTSYSRAEGEYAVQLETLVIPIQIEPGYQPGDWLSLYFGTDVLLNLSKLEYLNQGIMQLKEKLENRGKQKEQPIDYSGLIPDNAAPLWLFSELQVCGNFLDYLPDDAAQDPSDYIMPCLSATTTSVIKSRMQMMKNSVEEAVFQNGGISSNVQSSSEVRFNRSGFSGSATVLLPQKLSKQDVDWPSQMLLHRELNSHPLCYTRGDMSVVMTMSPVQPLSSAGAMYWMAHILDCEGFPYTINMESIEFPLLWAWHLILATSQQYHLSSYDAIFADVKGMKYSKVSASITNFLQRMCMFLFIGLGSDISNKYFTDFPQLDAAIKSMVGEMSDKLDKCGLTLVEPMFSDDPIYLCETHRSAWNAGKDIPTVPTETFDKYSHFIRSLQLQGNKLTSLPRELFTRLCNMMDFDISVNEISELPEEIGNCRFMNSLSIQQNNLRELPESLSNCQEIFRLDISGNTFMEIPPCVIKLKKLSRFYAQNMQLMSLPEDFGNLEELTKLYLGGNCFSRLPQSFTNLQKLQELGLNGVSWCQVKLNTLLSKEHFEDILKSYHLMSWMEKHDQDKAAIFKFFDEDANGTLDPREIGKLNATIFYTFPRFGYMGGETPDDDTPHGFPLEILSLKKLEYLSLQYQAIVSLPDDIDTLKNLTVLNLRHNPNLLSVPAQTGNLPLKRLELDDCPLLKTPPKEIRVKGFATTFAYLQRLLSGSVECQRTKLMLVGLGGAGKTSLVKALLSGKHKTELAQGEDITDGIDICPWSVFTEDGQVTYSVWDFAGQAVYYNTHQFFLSDRAVYMLLWNIRLGFEHAGLDFWLSSISVHAPNSPIFVVGSHVDQVSKVELPINEMQERYPQIAGFHFVSSHTGQGVKELQDNLLAVTLKQQYMGEKIPGVWLRFEDSIASLKNQSVIEYKELEKRANNSGIFDQSEVFQAVQFLHELGSLQHFTNEYLKAYVVVNPQWIVDVMACVVSVKDSHIKAGRLNHEDIANVWKDYPTELHSWMLRLTEEFDLTFPLISEKTNLVPCLLPEKEPEIYWPEIDKNSSLREAKMVYKFDYLPAGLFNRGQVRLHQFSDSSTIWKRGSFLKKNKHICLIHQTRDSELVVRAQGPRPENIVFLVHEVFETLIAESFQGVTYDYYLPCPDCMKLMLKDPHMFAASTVRRAKELKAPFLQCLKYFHIVSLITLQAQMPPNSSIDYDIHLVQAMQGLKELHKDLLTDIFVIYCQNDIPSVQNSHKLINPLKIFKDLKAVNYKCWYQEASDKCEVDQLIRALMDSSIVLVLISDAFVQDEESCNLFKYARLTLKKPILLVVVGTGMQWKQNKLGILLADEVFVNMLQPERYDSKIKELISLLEVRISKKDMLIKDFPPCFISYCWKNSASAIALGSKSTEGSVGIGDPRKVKSYLEENDIKCWIDVEMIGLHGLFEDIGEGLLNAKVVVVCVSDEYAASGSCAMEFRYAAKSLKLPIILAVVGTGNKWRATEIGVLSLNYPLISFQEKFDSPAERLCELVKGMLSTLTAKETDETKDTKNKTNEDQKNLSFQELYELAQRKFLRQLIHYADSQDTPYPYPRLFLVDLVPQTTAVDEESTETSNLTESKIEDKVETKGAHSFCVQILCEHDEGWHCCSEPIPLQCDSGNSPKERFAPYLTRIMGIAKYSKKLLLQCMSTQAGKDYLKWLEESPQVTAASDFHETYQNLRQEVIAADSSRDMGDLARCHLPNGKTTWLCKDHRSKMRVTVLSDEVVEVSRTTSDSMVVDYMTQSMRDSEAKELSKKFSHLRQGQQSRNDTTSTCSESSVSEVSQFPAITEGITTAAGEETKQTNTNNNAECSPTNLTKQQSTKIPPSGALRQLSRRSSSKQSLNKSRACSIQ